MTISTTYTLTPVQVLCKKKFRNYSNQALIDRANAAEDFQWDDEGCEISRRRDHSEGKLIIKMQGNKLAIIQDL